MSRERLAGKILHCKRSRRDKASTTGLRPVNRRPAAVQSGNLYGYGYRNVFELGEAVGMDEPSVGWVGAET